MTYNTKSHRVISPITKVRFQGFVSDTLTLQNYGWEISAEQNPAQMSIRIAMKNSRAGLILISSQHQYRLYEFDGFQGKDDIEINQVIHRDTRIMIQGDFNLNAFATIDASPAIIEMKEMSYDDFKMFNEINISRTNELIIAPDQVAEALNQIKQLQNPKQKELREKMRRRISNNMGFENKSYKETFHAQIISIAA